MRGLYELRGLERRRNCLAGRELSGSLRLFARELLTLAGTEFNPFSSAAVNQTAVLQLEELLLLITSGNWSVQSLKQAPLWESACWIVGAAVSRLEPRVGDPAVDPVLEAARKAEAQLR